MSLYCLFFTFVRKIKALFKKSPGAAPLPADWKGFATLTSPQKPFIICTLNYRLNMAAVDKKCVAPFGILLKCHTVHQGKTIDITIRKLYTQTF